MSRSNTANRFFALLLLGAMLGACDNSDSPDKRAQQDAGVEDVLEDAAPQADAGDTGQDAAPDAGEDVSAEDVSADGDGAAADAADAGEDGLSQDAGPDAVDPVEPTEARGELDITFAASQPTPGLFVGPPELRSDASALMLTPADDLVMAGRGRLNEEAAAMFSMRLDAAGALDSTYGTNGIHMLPLSPDERDIVVLAGATQKDGKRLICGNVRATQMGRAQLFVARLHADGTPDTTFGNDPQMPGRAYFDVPTDKPNSLCWTLKVLGDQKILVGGQIGANNTMTPLLMRLKADGTLDTTFGNRVETPGIMLHEIAPENPWLWAKIRELSVLDDGKILALIDSAELRTGHQNGYLLRYHSDGQIDESFGNDPDHPGLVTLELPDGVSHEVFDFALAPDDGRIYIAGKKQHLAGLDLMRFFVHALDSNGQVAPSFATDGTYVLDDLHAAARAILLQPNGKIIAVGSAMTHPNEAFEAGELLVVRLGPDGAPDTSFAASALNQGVFVWSHPTHAFYAARAALDSAGRLVIVGSTPDDPNQSPRGHSFALRIR